ncbi:MAG: crossover junction endodeoxyribonuclease RuvC, partial [Minisyncoccia bacterium]
MRILAIDPGYDRMGIAVLEGNASHPTLVWSGCIQPPKGEREERLGVLSEAIRKTIQEYNPERFVLETLYFGANKKTAIGVAEARGVALSLAGTFGVEVREYAPSTVKLAVTGNGRADKKAIAAM